jgi:serine/threonine protein kinase
MQGLIEVKILSKLNKELDPNDTNHIVRMVDYFVFRNHLIIIFELLSLNIYELIRKNGMLGFSLSLIRSFTKQMLEALCLMEKGNIIHCDMKPENVLLVSDRGNIKVIDFGSACFENATIYTYIQSRYYRSPEVLIGLPYGSEIDSWSLACICAELYIGIPLFPGSNEHEQLYRIIQWLEPPPQSMISDGKFRDKFFAFDGERYRLKTFEEYSRVRNK